MASRVYLRTHKAKIAAPGTTNVSALAPFMGSYVFDLLDVDSGSTEFMDDTAKAYFWHLVASFLQGSGSPLGRPASPPPTEVATLAATSRPPVVGLVGGRSGSTDLPGFVGLRVYSWEEPMLAALDGKPTPTSSGPWTSKYYDIQGPQAMRLFNQYPVVVTGFLDIKDFEKTGSVREYKHINVSDGTLERWLKWDDGIPPLPPNANLTFLRKFFTTYKAKIEKKNGGVQVSAVSLAPWEAAVEVHQPVAATAGGGPIRPPSRTPSKQSLPYAR
ncbi:hypothetical protein VTI74DRAFT_8602 [Chaetomium olivicolor]